MVTLVPCCCCWTGALAWCETEKATEPAAIATTAAAAAMKGIGRWWSDGALRVARTECDVRRWTIDVRVNAYVACCTVAVAWRY